jgi:hypothetical protein
MLPRLMSLSGILLSLACANGQQDDFAEETSELSVVAGAEAVPNFAFADIAPKRVFHVATWGNDANNGAAATPWRTLNKAVRTVVAGDAIDVHAGTYAERVVIGDSSKDGTASAPIHLRAAAGEVVTLKGGDSKSGPMVRLYRRSYWVVSGLNIDVAGSLAHAVRVEGARNVVVRNNHIFGGTGPSAVPIYAGATDVALVGNKIHDYTWSGQDSHGILIMPDTARILIRGNESYRNGGDSLQCVGPDATSGTLVATNITIENNRFHEDRENAVDIKTCDRVTIRGNKFYGYKSTPSAVQGDAVVVHCSASKVLIERNRMWGNGRSIGIGGVLIWPTPVSDVIVRRNLFFDNAILTSEAGDGIHVGTSRRVKIQNNTFFNIARAALRVGFGSSGPSESTEITNNIVSNAPRGIDIARSASTGFVSDRNVFFSPSSSMLRLDGSLVSLATWQSKTAQDKASSFSDPLFVANPNYNDFYTQAGSPARDRGFSTGESFCFAATDVGFLETCF